MLNNYKGPVLIFVGAILVLFGVYLNRNIPEENRSIEETKEVTNSSGQIKTESDFQSNESFRNFVGNKFSSRFFSINNIDLSNRFSLTDIEVLYNLRGQSGVFYVKTLWLRQYSENQIPIVSQEQLIQMNERSKNGGDPLFIILGIGGQPNNPRLLYIIPSEEIQTSEMSIYQVSNFKKENLTSNFYYDIDEKLLR